MIIILVIYEIMPNNKIDVNVKGTCVGDFYLNVATDVEWALIRVFTYLMRMIKVYLARRFGGAPERLLQKFFFHVLTKH